MEIQIKNVTSRTDFEASDSGLLMAGSYEKNQDNQLTQLSATVYNQQQGIAGDVRANRTQSGLRYNYNGIADEDFDGIRAIARAVVANAENNEEEGGES